MRFAVDGDRGMKMEGFMFAQKGTIVVWVWKGGLGDVSLNGIGWLFDGEE